jgi:hypothetical protein
MLSIQPGSSSKSSRAKPNTQNPNEIKGEQPLSLFYFDVMHRKKFPKQIYQVDLSNYFSQIVSAIAFDSGCAQDKLQQDNVDDTGARKEQLRKIRMPRHVDRRIQSRTPVRLQHRRSAGPL